MISFVGLRNADNTLDDEVVKRMLVCYQSLFSTLALRIIKQYYLATVDWQVTEQKISATFIFFLGLFSLRLKPSPFFNCSTGILAFFRKVREEAKVPQKLSDILVGISISEFVDYPVEISSPNDVNISPELSLDGKKVGH